MAGETLSAISAALSQLFAPTAYDQFNRTAPLLSILSASDAGIEAGAGKNAAFDVGFSGATAATVAEGSDVSASEYAQDLYVPAVLPWATYRSSFQMSEMEMAAAFGSDGTPDKVRRIFEARVRGGITKIARTIEQDILTGSGVDSNGNPTIVGLYSACINSGSYAGINSSTYTEWQSNLYFNGGSTRSLTTDLMEQADAGIFTGSNEQWDFIMTDAQIVRKYAGIFTNPTAPMIRFNDMAGNPMYGAGVANGIGMQPDGLLFKGKPVLRNAVNPTGKLIFVNKRHVQIKYLPRVPTPVDSMYLQMVAAEGSNGSDVNQATRLPVRITALAKTGDSQKFTMNVMAQMCVTRPNAFAVIGDISEA